MDALEAVGDPQLRQALQFARGRERAVTADELAAVQGVHRNVARSRLERLVQAGLLEPRYERRTGRTGPGAGRPAKTYAVVPELAPIQFPERHYEDLLGLVLDSLDPDDRPEELRKIGAAFGRRLATAARLRPAATLEHGVERVCSAVRRLGFQASVEHADADVAVIATPTCPLRPLVRVRPEAAILDRGMWAGLAACALADVEVDGVWCETRDCLDDHASCRVRLQLTSERS